MKANTLQDDCLESIPKRREYFPGCASGYVSVAAFQKLRLALEPFAWLAQFEGGCLRHVLAVDAEGHAQLLDALRPFAEASEEAIRAACALFRLPASAEGGESRDSYESLSMAADFRLARTLCLAARRELRP